jgi:hypothetical protein
VAVAAPESREAPAAAADASGAPTAGDAAAAQQGPPTPMPRSAPPPARWRPGQAAFQGYLGAAFVEVSREGSAFDLQDDDATMPVIGGGAQWKLAGDKLDFGFESLLSFAWGGDLAGSVSTGGGAAFAVDVDVLVFDFLGGPFVGAFLGDRARIYAAAGPVLRWGVYDQDGPTALTSGDGSGFGVGYYARTGIEFGVARSTMIGVGALWSDVELDLSGGLGDLDVDGFQAFVTVTQGL